MNGADRKPDDEFVAHLSAGLEPAGMRHVYLAALGRLSRASSGLKLVLAIDALRYCWSDGGSVISARAYERWRLTHPGSRELPSARFIARAFDDRWAAALDAAGLPVSPGRRVQQQNPQTGGFDRDEVLAALERWVASETQAVRLAPGSIPDTALTFVHYLAWAKAELDRDPSERLPLSAPTFRRYLGTWRAAVAAARRRSS